MRLCALIVALFLSILVFGVSDSASAQTPANEKKEAKKSQNNKPAKKFVVVKPGDSLSKIAKKHETTHKRLFNANTKVSDPDLIYPGDKLRIPAANEKLKDRAVAASNPIKPQAAQQYSYTPRANHSSAPSQSSGGSGVWDRLAQCESGGNWSINTGNGYYGGLQFNQGTWTANGGKGSPHTASKSEQIRVAENLRAARGYSPWPACSAKLGLR